MCALYGHILSFIPHCLDDCVLSGLWLSLHIESEEERGDKDIVNIRIRSFRLGRGRKIFFSCSPGQFIYVKDFAPLTIQASLTIIWCWVKT